MKGHGQPATTRRALIWFDIGFTPTKAQSNELYDMVRRLQPGCLINSRIGCGKCDYTSSGDNEIPGRFGDSPLASFIAVGTDPGDPLIF